MFEGEVTPEIATLFDYTPPNSNSTMYGTTESQFPTSSPSQIATTLNPRQQLMNSLNITNIDAMTLQLYDIFLSNLPANLTSSNPSYKESLSKILVNLTLEYQAHHKSESESDIYQVPPALVVLLCIFYGIISLVAVAGNFLVMWVVATSRVLHTVTNYFIANLAVADIIIGLFSIPFQVRLLEANIELFFLCVNHLFCIYLF